jgi:hypothetical protein
MKNTSPLQRLVGEKLSSVTFVMDYVQLRFDGPLLTAYTGPDVTFGGKVFAWGKPGFRDALCERIGAIVRQAEVVNDDAIRLRFSDGGVISISLKSEDYVGPEAAQLTDSTGDSELIVVY